MFSSSRVAPFVVVHGWHDAPPVLDAAERIRHARSPPAPTLARSAKDWKRLETTSKGRESLIVMVNDRGAPGSLRRVTTTKPPSSAGCWKGQNLPLLDSVEYPPFRHMLALWTYRNFVWRTALADLRHRYAGSGLGVVWNVVTPLAMLSIYGFIFANAFSSRLGSGQVARATFALYLSSGFLPWAAFADCVTRGTNAFIVNAAFLKKMAIPEQVFVAQTAVSATIGMLISLGLLGVLALVLGAPGHWSWLLLPLIGILWQILGFGLGLALGALNVFFRDVSQLLGVALQIWMWSLPVVYLEDVLPDAYRASLPLNPGYPFLHGLRAAFIDAMLPDAWTWGGMLGWGLVATLVGYAVLHGLRAEIRDHL